MLLSKGGQVTRVDYSAEVGKPDDIPSWKDRIVRPPGLWVVMALILVLAGLRVGDREVAVDDARVSADGLALTFSDVPCDTEVSADETATAVWLQAVSKSSSIYGQTLGCTGEVSITLEAPLGERVLIDPVLERWIPVRSG